MWTNLIKHRPAAKETIDLEFRAVFSQRSATRLKRLSGPRPCSMRARALVESAGEESRLVLFVGFVGDDGSNTARSRGVPVGPAGVAFVADDGAGLNVGPDVKQGFEVTPVEGFAAGQVEGDDGAGGVRFCVDFRGEAATRPPERLPFLPAFAPAADTCARTTVESNI